VQVSSELAASLGPVLFQTTVSRSFDRLVHRGLTNLTIDRPSRLQRWVLGDTLAGSGPLGGSGVLAGVSVAREYALDPYFVRFPGIDFATVLGTPAVLEVYVNEQLVRRERLPAGSVHLDNLAAEAGRVDARFVLRDAFGRQHELSSFSYVPTGLLAKGLHEYRYAAGALRAASLSNVGYGGVVGLGYHRYGIADWLTAGFRVEGGRDLLNGGPVLGFSVRRLGEVEVHVVSSAGRGRSGLAAALGYSFVSRSFSATASVRAFTSEYATFDSTTRSIRPLRNVDFSAGAPLSQIGSLAVEHAHARYSAAGRQRAEDRTGIRFTRPVRRSMALFARATRRRVDRRPFNEFAVGLSWTAHRQTSATAAVRYAERRVASSIDVQQALPFGPGVGYSAGLSTVPGEPVLMHARVAAQNRFARVDVLEGPTARPSVSLSGAIVGIGGHLFAARPIEESFALVQVPDVEGLQVRRWNHDVGRTDRRGNLLVPGLSAYYGNDLEVDDSDQPIALSLGTTRRTIAPPTRGGAVVRFEAKWLRIVIGRLVVQVAREGAVQEVVPAYGELTLTVGGEPITSPIGEAGNFYFENLPPGRFPAVVRSGGRTCALTITIPAGDRNSPVRLGTLVCRSWEDVR
jgi:outer membrane usher protein